MTGENALRQPEVAKQTEVAAEVSNLHTTAKMLEESVAMLENRLVTVLAERKLEGGSAGNSPEPVRVPLAEELHSAVATFRQIRDRIGSIVARIEL